MSEFKENEEDLKKNQNYKNHFKEYDLPKNHFILEMYNRQKELQEFLASKGKTSSFPSKIQDVKQKDVQLAIYHLFCMQIEFKELEVELYKLFNKETEDTLDARYELIDMFFFAFNVGIYTGLDINSVINFYKGMVNKEESAGNYLQIDYLHRAVRDLMNYIDKLPWKAWKEYNYNTFNFSNSDIIISYTNAIKNLVDYAKISLKETDQSLYNLYMNKWEENKRRQIDVSSGYILSK